MIICWIRFTLSIFVLLGLFLGFEIYRFPISFWLRLLIKGHLDLHKGLYLREGLFMVNATDGFMEGFRDLGFLGEPKVISPCSIFYYVKGLGVVEVWAANYIL